MQVEDGALNSNIFSNSLNAVCFSLYYFHIYLADLTSPILAYTVCMPIPLAFARSISMCVGYIFPFSFTDGILFLVSTFESVCLNLSSFFFRVRHLSFKSLTILNQCTTPRVDLPISLLLELIMAPAWIPVRGRAGAHLS